jgi:transposase
MDVEPPLSWSLRLKEPALLPLDLFPGAGLRLDDLVLTPAAAVALLVSTAPTVACPHCGTPSDRVHSRYRRTVADLPGTGRTLALRLIVRRFRCSQADCPQSIFCERLPGLLDAHARSTSRLTEAHRAIGFALGGEAGHRLAEHLAMPTSADTLLRRVKDAPDEPAPPPRYVGIDDWALRKGQRYGTILIDLERRRVLDLLPGRDGEALKAWLKEHPSVEVITRDRWAAFAQAATEAAPQAKQVADRWHLLKNLREAVERLLARMSGAVHQALRATPASEEGKPLGAGPSGDAETSTHPLPSAAAPAGAIPTRRPPSARQPEREAKQHRRVAQYEHVRKLRAEGRSLRAIAKATGVTLKRVIRYVRRDRCPDWNPGRRSRTQLDAFAAQVDAWIGRGERNAADLYRELVAQGCRASYDAVRRFVQRRLGSTGRPGPRVGPLTPPAAPAPPSARQRSFAFIRREGDRTEEQQRQVEQIQAGGEPLRDGLQLAASFAALVRKSVTGSLGDWLAKAEGAGCAEMRAFAGSLRQDEAAVTAALTEAWSNGPVEGQVNRLKLIKRSMYGRAGWKLLRARVRRAG